MAQGNWDINSWNQGFVTGISVVGVDNGANFNNGIRHVSFAIELSRIKVRTVSFGTDFESLRFSGSTGVYLEKATITEEGEIIWP